MPRAGGPLGVMLDDHERGRSLVKILTEAVERYRDHSPGAGLLWAKYAREFAGLLRQHIHKENTVLFWVADQMLTEAEQEDLAQKFKAHSAMSPSFDVEPVCSVSEDAAPAHVLVG